MPVLRQKMIYRDDLRANPNTLYLFGDNHIRKGYGGQANEMRGEPNAFGIRTKWFPANDPEAFFRDDAFDACAAMISEDLERVELHLSAGGVVVIPADGIGTGYAQLEERAPKVAEYLRDRLARLGDDRPR